MPRIYVGQTKLTVRYVQDLDLSGAEVEISVRKPGGNISVISSTIDGDSKTILMESWDGFLDVAGAYKIQPKITFSDGKVAYGETMDMIVNSLFE